MCRLLFSILSVALLGYSCIGRHASSDKPLRTVKVGVVQGVDFIERDFAGMATADDATMLAFKISGQVASVDVGKGDMVRRGELLATLDARDVELQVASDRSQYERASSQYERMRRLLEHDAVSQQEVESAEAAFVQARSKYENSKDLLVETKLRAPFAGVIERTYVDAFQRVDAGQTILRLVNPVSTTVEFTMSERSMFLLADSTTRYYVRFDNYPSHRFAARLDSYAKTASDASGFPVSLKLSKDETRNYHITPGMTCQVTIRASESMANLVAIPLTAVYAPAAGGTYVWRVGPDNRVQLCAVQLGSLFGRDMVTVQSGLSKGDVVVTAGVYRLEEGEEVKIIK
ncbi:MAG: efflux RND transporter periplasmic adaptor subunit [Alistipes sp.]|nr:efflux RND transporter periplasmic adaptor subunit [Alistipes sp.]